MTLFGEVVEPTSRALYIDESSDEEDTREDVVPKVEKIEWFDERPASLEKLLVFHGQLAADFLLKILEGTKSKSALQLKERFLHRGKSAKELNILMFKLSSGIFGCLCPSLDIASSNDILDKLIPVFKTCKQVVVISTVPAPFYKGNDSTLDLPPSFMKMLFTSTYDSKDVIAPLLEPPNMATGVPASILSWCEVFKKPGCLYVCYSDTPHLDSISAEPLVNIFSHVFEGLYEPKVLSFRSAVQEPSSNLYM